MRNNHKAISCNGPLHSAREATASTVWERSLDREVAEARSACLQGLHRIPTGLGRLAYLAILQQQLLEDHEELFSDFRYCSLQEKYEWLYRLAASASHNGTLPGEWMAQSTYSGLVPRSAEPAARQDYLMDIETILELVRKELGRVRDTSSQGMPANVNRDEICAI